MYFHYDTDNNICKCGNIGYWRNNPFEVFCDVCSKNQNNCFFDYCMFQLLSKLEKYSSFEDVASDSIRCPCGKIPMDGIFRPPNGIVCKCQPTYCRDCADKIYNSQHGYQCPMCSVTTYKFVPTYNDIVLGLMVEQVSCAFMYIE